MNEPLPELSREELISRYGRAEPSPPAAPRSPFKSLDPYEEVDRSIYFGRESEIRALARQFHSFAHVVVYGESGAGKSSLLQCGFRARFPEADALFVTLRLHDLSTEAMCRKIALQASHRIDEPIELSADQDLGECLREVSAASSRPIVLMFEQFEDLFTRYASEDRIRFAEKLAELARTRLNLMIIMVIQQEYLARLSELEPIVAGLFDNRFWLPPMSRSRAAAAIAQACSVCQVPIEDGVPESIVERMDPHNTGISLPSLQVLMEGMYQEALRTNAMPGITAAAAARLGDVRHVLETFLREGLKQVSDLAVGRHLLEACVTEEGAAVPVNQQALLDQLSAQGGRMTAAQIDATTQELVAAGILRPTDETGLYELRHTVLARPVSNWLHETAAPPRAGHLGLLCGVLGALLVVAAVMSGAEWQKANRIESELARARKEIDELRGKSEPVVPPPGQEPEPTTPPPDQPDVSSNPPVGPTAPDVVIPPELPVPPNLPPPPPVAISPAPGPHPTESPVIVPPNLPPPPPVAISPAPGPRPTEPPVIVPPNLPPPPPVAISPAPGPHPTEPPVIVPPNLPPPPPVVIKWEPPMSIVDILPRPGTEDPGPDVPVCTVGYFVMRSVSDVGVSHKLKLKLKEPFQAEDVDVSLSKLTSVASEVTPDGEGKKLMTWYTITQESLEQVHVITIRNEFGDVQVTLGRPVGVFAPARRSTDDPQTAPGENHYKGYVVLISCRKGDAPEEEPCQEIDLSGVHTYRPVLVCVPVETTWEENRATIRGARNCLAFYPGSSAPEMENFEVRDEFGANKLNPGPGNLLGVPSRILGDEPESE